MQGVAKAIQKNVAKIEPSVVLQLSRYLETKGFKEKSMQVLAMAYKHHKNDMMVQARYLTVLADVDFEQAEELYQSLPQPELVEEGQNENELIQQLIEEGMPERKKDKKTKDVGLEELGGGATIYIPKKRKHKTRFPKSYDPENPGPLPDPERWLPKWQRSRYKKLAKKKGMYIKGAQGDAQVNTDVTNLANSTAAPAQVSQGGKRNKR